MTRNTILSALVSTDASRQPSPDRLQQKIRCRTPVLLMLEDVRGKISDNLEPDGKLLAELEDSPRNYVKVFEVLAAPKTTEVGRG